jgi:hypothetical protein
MLLLMPRKLPTELGTRHVDRSKSIVTHIRKKSESLESGLPLAPTWEKMMVVMDGQGEEVLGIHWAVVAGGW